MIVSLYFRVYCDYTRLVLELELVLIIQYPIMIQYLGGGEGWSMYSMNRVYVYSRFSVELHDLDSFNYVHI